MEEEWRRIRRKWMEADPHDGGEWIWMEEEPHDMEMEHGIGWRWKHTTRRRSSTKLEEAEPYGAEENGCR